MVARRQILREVEYGRSVDWWAFGVLLYEMLLSEVPPRPHRQCPCVTAAYGRWGEVFVMRRGRWQSPFEGQDEDEIFRSILTAEIKYPASLQPPAAALMRKVGWRGRPPPQPSVTLATC